jgi:glycosyltransferase involved in cell wall biosynthesis
LKILHVDMGRPLDGGARQLAYLLNGVDKLPGDHGLVCPSGAEVLAEINASAVKIHRMKAAEEKGGKFTGALRKLIRREKPDLLHIHGRPGDGAALWAGMREKRQMVYTRRADTPLSLFERYLKLPRFVKIITPSQGIRRRLTDVGMPAERIVHIPCAVDGNRFKPQPKERELFRAQFGLGGEGPILGMVAQWAPNKGHGVLFGALPAILAKYPGIRVLVMGRGPGKNALQKELARRGLEKYVRLEGFRADLENVLPQFDLLVHPSFEDGMAVSLLEAAACGVPVVASRVGGIPDVVQDRFNGYLIKPGDSINLARHIVSLLEDHDHLVQFGHTGREIMLDKFTVDKMLAAHRDLYRYI